MNRHATLPHLYEKTIVIFAILKLIDIDTVAVAYQWHSDKAVTLRVAHINYFYIFDLPYQLVVIHKY